MKKKNKNSIIKYTIDISWSEDDKCYVVRVPGLPGCVTEGDSLDEAALNAKTAIELYLETLDEKGLPHPAALSEMKFSGKYPLRIEPELHRELAKKAMLENESLNQFIKKSLKKL